MSRYRPKGAQHRTAKAVLTAPVANAPDDLLTTREVARWLRVSKEWLELGRTRGYGPRFVRQGLKSVRYRRSDVLAFINKNTFASTAEYPSEAV